MIKTSKKVSYCGLAITLLSSFGTKADNSLNQDIKAVVEQEIHSQLIRTYTLISNVDIRFRMSSSIDNLPECNGPLLLPSSDRIPLGNYRWTVSCEGQWDATVSTTTSVDVLAPTAVKTLKSGTRLSESDVENNWVNLNFPQKLILKKEDLMGLKTTRTVRKGKEFLIGQIGLDYDAVKGQKVTLLYRAEMFQVKSQGLLLANAQVGDKVAVKSVSSGKEMIGTLTGINTVEVY